MAAAAPYPRVTTAAKPHKTRFPAGSGFFASAVTDGSGFSATPARINEPPAGPDLLFQMIRKLRGRGADAQAFHGENMGVNGISRQGRNKLHAGGHLKIEAPLERKCARTSHNSNQQTKQTYLYETEKTEPYHPSHRGNSRHGYRSRQRGNHQSGSHVQ
jgi:hypothetical protein